MAYQLGFDLYESATQQFLQRVQASLRARVPGAAPTVESSSPEDTDRWTLLEIIILSINTMFSIHNMLYDAIVVYFMFFIIINNWQKQQSDIVFLFKVYKQIKLQLLNSVFNWDV